MFRKRAGLALILVSGFLISCQSAGEQEAPVLTEALTEASGQVDEPGESATLTTSDIVATQQANMAPTAFPMTLGAVDGATLTAFFPAPGALPLTSFEIETEYKDFYTIALEADGQEVFAWQVLGNSGRQAHTLTWNPWHGNGDYQLVLRLLTSAGEIIAEQPLAVKVEGIPGGTPTIRERFIQEYQAAFGLTLSEPIFTHVHDMWETEESINQWTSSVYMNDRYYSIRIHDAGWVDRRVGIIAEAPGAGTGVCPPKGVYDVLVVIVDYGNTGVSQQKILSELNKAAAETNALWAEHSAAMGLAEPIIQLNPTFVYLDSPPVPGSFVTHQQILERAGVMSTDWDIVAEVDLDAEESSQPFSAGGMAFPGFCSPTPPEGISMIVWVQDQRNAESKGYSLFGHEFYHVLGWEHEWLSGDGGTLSRLDTWQVFPYRFLGWSDADGDGVIEIFDPTPYGIGTS